MDTAWSPLPQPGRGPGLFGAVEPCLAATNGGVSLKTITFAARGTHCEIHVLAPGSRRGPAPRWKQSSPGGIREEARQGGLLLRRAEVSGRGRGPQASGSLAERRQIGRRDAGEVQNDL